MNVDIKQYSSNQGVVLHVNGKSVTVKEESEDGSRRIYRIKKTPINRYSFTKKGCKIALGSILCLILCIAITKITTRPVVEDRLYEKYYRPIKEGSAILVLGQSAFGEAKKRYNKGDNVAAWHIMKNLPNNLSMEKERFFYLALISMELENYTEAIELFDSLIALPTNKEILSGVNWYQGLCFLKTRQIDKAKDSFYQITTHPNKVYAKSSAILEALNKQK